MTIETQASSILDTVNESTDNEKSIISRLIIGKILSSGILPFLDKAEHKKLTEEFLSPSPSLDFAVQMTDPDGMSNSSYYYRTIASVKFGWSESNVEIIDGTGNAWVTYTFLCNPSISSTSSGSGPAALKLFTSRTDCIIALRELVDELCDMVSQPIRIVKFNNDQRIERDKQAAYSSVVKRLRDDLSKHGANFKARLKLRTGGSDRRIHLSKFGFVVPPAAGNYYIAINDGSSRRPDMKYFLVAVRAGGYNFDPLCAVITRIKNPDAQ